jgi:hypothetical protein
MLACLGSSFDNKNVAQVRSKVLQIFDHVPMVRGMLEYIRQRHFSGEDLRRIESISRIRGKLGNPQQ